MMIFNSYVKLPEGRSPFYVENKNRVPRCPAHVFPNALAPHRIVAEFYGLW
jgi:hypothetical protein